MNSPDEIIGEKLWLGIDTLGSLITHA